MFLTTALVSLAAVCCLAEAVHTSNHDRLVTDLVEDYLTSVDPGNFALQISVHLLCSRYNKDTSELTSTVWESYVWKDNRLRWTPSEYGGITTIRLPAHMIWTPDVRLYNSLYGEVDRQETNVVLASDGSVIWVPAATYKTLCETSSTSEDIKCELRLGSWTYDALQIDLQKQGEGVEFGDYYKACPLSVIDSKAAVVSRHYPQVKEPYSSLDIELTLTPRK